MCFCSVETMKNWNFVNYAYLIDTAMIIHNMKHLETFWMIDATLYRLIIEESEMAGEALSS